jgi:glycosyltransferase involved in cell wall biosynthesis
LEDLLAAFALLPERERGTLLIAGAAKDPAYADAIERQAQAIAGARVDRHFVPDQAVPTYLAAADLVVLPYHSLLTSGILLWAQSYARPVVAPAFGPVRELVHEGQEGFLFTPHDRESLRAALARAIAHPHLEELGQAGLQVARGFDWQSIAVRTAQVYIEATADH